MAPSKPRIVAVPLVAVGHATPMMHLCSYLSKNFAITFVIAGGRIPLKKLIEERGTWPPPGADVTLVELGNPSSNPLKNFISNDGKLSMTDANFKARTHADGLEKLVREINGVSLILAEYQYSWVIDVAEKLEIPGAVLFTGCSTWSWFELNMPFLVSEKLIPCKDGLLAEEDDGVISEDPFLRKSNIPWHFWGCEDGKDFREFTLTYNVPVWEKAKWILVNTCEPLEERMVRFMAKSLGPSKYLSVGPLFLANDERERVGFQAYNRDSINWLDEQENSSVLYIAFGSLASLPVDQREEFALGLKASNQKFLWVVRSDEDSEHYRKILESGRGIMVHWSPQLDVLSHAAIGAFLSHCGWNSTLEAVTNGQPIICWPCLFDQNINSKFIVEEWRMGAWLTRKAGSNVVKRNEVEQVIRMVMEGDEGKEMRKRAKQLSKQVQNAVTEGSSRVNLEAFVEDIKKL